GISFALTKIKTRKYDIIYPDTNIGETFEKEGLQTNEIKENPPEEKLFDEYDPGVSIFIEAGKLASGKVEITAKIILRKNQTELFSKVYELDEKRQKPSRNVVNSANPNQIRTTYYWNSAPLFAPAPYYWNYPYNSYNYWGWGYPFYNPRYRYWRPRSHYSRPYHKR
ncbi:MAG: hypothetical protein KAR20_25680, partial [Candidatus Heimdallarchaeota archaeon]|nr:hypothetical protein [Candidatus Heimdallarchaeota archaeon]